MYLSVLPVKPLVPGHEKQCHLKHIVHYPSYRYLNAKRNWFMMTLIHCGVWVRDSVTLCCRQPWRIQTTLWHPSRAAQKHTVTRVHSHLHTTQYSPSPTPWNVSYFPQCCTARETQEHRPNGLWHNREIRAFLQQSASIRFHSTVPNNKWNNCCTLGVCQTFCTGNRTQSVLLKYIQNVPSCLWWGEILAFLCVPQNAMCKMKFSIVSFMSLTSLPIYRLTWPNKLELDLASFVALSLVIHHRPVRATHGSLCCPRTCRG